MLNINKQFRVYVLDKAQSANLSTEERLEIDTGYDFVCQQVVATATSRSFSVKIRDSKSGIWNGTKIPANLFVGKGIFPFNLPVYRRVPAGAQIYVEIEDTSGSTNTVQIAFIGYQERVDRQPYITLKNTVFGEKLRTYLVTETLVASTMKYNNLKIDANAHFLIRGIIDTHTAGRTYKIKFHDSYFKEWSNLLVNNENMVASYVNYGIDGSTSFNYVVPFWLPTPRLLVAGSVLNYDILPDASGDTLNLAFIGDDIPVSR